MAFQSAAERAEYRPNALLKTLYGRFFAHIEIDDRWSHSVQSAAERGVVIYVMRSISFLDFLCLDFLVKRFDLPLVRFVNDLGLGILEPFGRGGRRLRFRRQLPESDALRATVGDKHSALLFLRGPPRLGRVDRHHNGAPLELLGTLVALQRQMDEPIVLSPQTFLWGKRPAKRTRSVVDLVFGPREWPGRVRVAMHFLLNYRNAVLRSGEPFDLQEFLRANPELSDAEAAKKVRYAMISRIEREWKLVVGPRKKSADRIRAEILRSPRVARHIDQQAEETGKPRDAVVREAAKELRKLCADPNPYALGWYHRILDRVWNRIYDGLVVDHEGLERLRAVAREGPVVLLPSHKSHIDYLVLSDVFYSNALQVPLVAAGDNLSFWPLGQLFRWAGGFFIRRSFKGRKLYSALVDAYLRKLLAEGFNVEFFIEGGRSRTGKVLPPKYGLMSMMVDAALSMPHVPLRFVPISITYEHILEGGAYQKEAEGGEKRPEGIGDLLKAPSVLRSKYGRLFLAFGEILDIDEAREQMRRGQGLDADERRQLVHRLAHRTAYEINQATVVTPATLVAAALLSHRKRGMKQSELLQTATTLHRSLGGARTSEALVAAGGGLRADTLDAAVQLFVERGLVVQHGSGRDAVFRLPEQKRLALEFYKNNMVHFFVARALIALAFDAEQGPAVPLSQLRARVQNLSRLLKYEFMFRADASFETIFDDAIEGMLGAGELEARAEHVAVSDHLQVQLYAEQVRGTMESYYLAARGLEMMLDHAMTRKDWLKQTIALGEELYLAGEIERREGISKPTVANALKAFTDLGMVIIQPSGRYALHNLDAVELRELCQRLAVYRG